MILNKERDKCLKPEHSSKMNNQKIEDVLDAAQEKNRNTLLNERKYSSKCLEQSKFPNSMFMHSDALY